LAIKGKGRTRSRRVIAAPPRAQLMVRKPPIWRRPLVWMLVGLLAIGGILAGVLVSLDHRHQRQLRYREVAAIQAFTDKLKATFPADAQTIPPDLIVFYPTVNADLDSLANGKLKPAAAVTKATALQASAQQASTAIQALSVARLISPDFTVTGTPTGKRNGGDIQAPGATQQQLLDAQFLMAEAFQTWQQMGVAFEAAAAVGGARQKALIEHAKQLNGLAGTEFDRGYRKVLTIRNTLGLTAPARQLPTAPGASP